MKMRISIISILAISILLSCQPKKEQVAENPIVSDDLHEHQGNLISSIAFGSCGHQDIDQPVLSLAASKNPDLFVFLGDNIYGDTYEMDTLRRKYEKLGAKSTFQELWQASQVLATWDDHDYGWNDSGRHYPFKEESKEIFLEFWQVPETDIRRERDGIYTSFMFSDSKRSIQVILLDLRSFRDDLRKYNGEPVDTLLYHYGIDYWPYETSDSTLMGKQQWQWLEETLTKPADIRIVASSTQFGITWNGYEAWANFPHEQARMLDLIKKTQANGVIFISGDVHYAEISKLKAEGLYPIYDVTASGITSTWGFATPNDHRIEGPVMENHFGLISVDWDQEDPMISMQIYDVEDNLRINHQVRLSELTFDDRQ